MARGSGARSDYVLASGVGHTVRELVSMSRSAPPVSTLLSPTSASIRASCAPPRPVIRWAIPRGRARSSAGRRVVSFEELISEMVRADQAELRDCSYATVISASR